MCKTGVRELLHILKAELNPSTVHEMVLDRAGTGFLAMGSSPCADRVFFPWQIGMLYPWQEELVPESMLFQKTL